MELGAIDAFVTVYESGSFSIAARRLHISQPALTKRIQLLEHSLGGRLFDRGRHGAVPTDLGRGLFPAGRQLVRDHATWRAAALRATRGETGHLVIGFGMSTISVAPHWVSRFRRLHPEISIDLEDLPSDEQIERMRSGHLHAGFVRSSAVPDEFTTRPVADDSLALATTDSTPPPRHDLFAPGSIRLRPGRGPGLHRQIQAWHTAADVPEPLQAQESDDLLTVLALVAAGAGVAVVPESAAAIAPPGVHLHRIDHPAARWTTVLAWPRSENAALLRFTASVGPSDTTTAPPHG